MLKKIFLKTKLPDKGYFESLKMVLYNNLFRINTFLIFEFDLQSEFESPSLSSEYEIKVLHHKELERFLPKNRNNLPREFSMDKIHGVEHCVVVLKDDQIAHISWLYMKGNPNRWFSLANDEASISYSYTFPEFRGKSLFPNVILASAKWLKDQNFKRILEAPNKNTIFTLNSFKKIPNFKKIGIVIQWFIFRPKFKA